MYYTTQVRVLTKRVSILISVDDLRPPRDDRDAVDLDARTRSRPVQHGREVVADPAPSSRHRRSEREAAGGAEL